MVGSGVSGMTAAYFLSRSHEVTVFEADDRLGGHTATKRVEAGGREWEIDTGFIVFNERTYPNFLRLLDELGVEKRDSDMSFSVRNDRTGLEYNGTSINSLFAQRSNILRPSFWRMVRDILRFYRSASELLEPGHEEVTLGDYLARGGYSREFIEWHMAPMTAAVWSATREGVDHFPARFLVEFFENHGFLQVDNRPQWYTVRGGSHAYIPALTAPYRERVRLSTPVRGLERSSSGVRVLTEGEAPEDFDAVVLATHSDTALRILGHGATEAEREVLGDLAYQPNEVVLHTDANLLPRRQLARASWNVHLTEGQSELVAVTYWMNLLQGLPLTDDTPQFCVTLNHTAGIDPEKVLGRYIYDHPVYTPAAVRAQARHGELNGSQRTWFAGAYWSYGFHEDGVKSAVEVCKDFGVGFGS